MNSLAKVLLMVAVVLTFKSRTDSAPARDGDPLLIGTMWKGKRSQRGGGPTGFDCEMKVTKRDGETFEAELYEKSGVIELTYIVKGTVKPVDPMNKEKGYKVEFTSFDAKDLKNTSAILEVPYKGTLSGKTLKGSWKLPEDSEFGQLEGDFEFELSK